MRPYVPPHFLPLSFAAKQRRGGWGVRFPLPMPVAHLFIAPHFDDVALSCGGEVARLVAAGETVSIVTVFAGVPPAAMPLTP